MGQQGTARRRFFHGPGTNNWDMALVKNTSISERVTLQFRAELFNVLNHPNFAQPIGDLGSPAFGGNPAVPNPQFGLSQQMLGQSLSGEGGFGGLNPLYQIGGPRSIQLALKLLF